MGGLIAKALKVAGAVISAAIIIEVAEAAASALFTEFLLQLSEQGWKALPKEKVVEVVEREVQKRVHVPAEQLKRIGEAVVHEFEHLGDIGRSAVGGALQ
jgi:phosphoribosyl-dephospho-CoA transferase